MKDPLFSSSPAGGWIAFGVLVVLLLAIDQLAHRGKRGESRRNAILWSIVWIAAGLLFNAFIWMASGGEAAQEFLAAYLIEKSLSLDNLVVFLVIFQSLNVPPQHQHQVLFWGILGAIVFRALFIALGVAVLERWNWLSVIFGAVLLYAAYRAFRKDPARKKENPTVAWLSAHVPVTHQMHGEKLIAREDGRRVATPLLIALVAIEVSDIFFAIDSVPAALSVTRVPFIVYSSNVFAILGLRALYLVLSKTLPRLRYLHYGLAGILAFAGLKLGLHEWVQVPPLTSIGVIVVLMAAAVGASLRAGRSPAGAAANSRAG